MGCDGFEATKLGDAIRLDPEIADDPMKVYDIALSLKFGCSKCLIVQTRTHFVFEGRAVWDLTPPEIDRDYREGFDNPRMTPRTGYVFDETSDDECDIVELDSKWELLQALPQGRGTIVLDLDGVLAKYDGWKGDDHIGEPVAGAKLFTECLKDRGYKIVVCTARDYLGPVRQWLIANGISFDDVTNVKVPAILYIDDRAHRFNGNWIDAARGITGSPYWRHDSEVETSDSNGNRGDQRS